MSIKRIMEIYRKIVPKSIRIIINKPRSIIFQWYWEKIGRLKPRKKLRFQTYPVRHCNLNCKNCGVFSSLVKEEYTDVNCFRRDCVRIAELCKQSKSQVSLIILAGGEPLLHPRIIDFIDITRGCFTESIITIITNGILLSKQSKEFWLTCSKNDITILISGYPIKLDKKQIANTAKQYKIDLTFSPPTHWGKYIIDINGTQNIKNKFRRCRFANTCIALEDGKLFTCARIPNIKYFNRYFNENLKVTESDYIDIYKARDMHEIFSFLSSPPPFCRYCPGEVSSEWGISKKEITEWT